MKHRIFRTLGILVLAVATLGVAAAPAVAGKVTPHVAVVNAYAHEAGYGQDLIVRVYLSAAFRGSASTTQAQFDYAVEWRDGSGNAIGSPAPYSLPYVGRTTVGGAYVSRPTSPLGVEVRLSGTLKQWSNRLKDYVSLDAVDTGWRSGGLFAVEWTTTNAGTDPLLFQHYD